MDRYYIYTLTNGKARANMVTGPMTRKQARELRDIYNKMYASNKRLYRGMVSHYQRIKD